MWGKSGRDAVATCVRTLIRSSFPPPPPSQPAPRIILPLSFPPPTSAAAAPAAAPVAPAAGATAAASSIVLGSRRYRVQVILPSGEAISVCDQVWYTCPVSRTKEPFATRKEIY